MNVFFDVDDTLIAWNGTLRPHVREVFQRLIEDGHKIYVWSGVGVRWDIVDRHGLRPFVTDCFLKPIYDYRDGLKRLGVPVEPDFCIDDHPELVRALGGEAVRPYFWVDERDREMLRVYEAITEFNSNHAG
ncbi:MAG: HAD hydrolase family protein [Dehalococcoidia bacterium]